MRPGFLLSSETIRSAIFRSVVINFVARIMGYLKNIAIIYYLGFSSATDTFFLAIGILEFFLVFTDVFDSIGVPNLVKVRDNKKEFYKISSSLFTYTIFLGIALSLILLSLLLFLKVIIGNYSSVTFSSLGLYVILLLPYLFSSLLFHHFGSILRSQRKFTIFFLGGLIASLTTLILVYILLRFYQNGIVLPISLSVGQCIAAGFIMLFCKDHLRISWYWDDTVRLIIKQFSQLVFIYFSYSVGSVVSRLFGMFFPVKSITALSYGLMISLMPKSILNLDSMFITSLSERMSVNKLNRYLIFVLLIFSSIAVIIYIFAEHIVNILFGYGMVTGLDMHLTSLTLKNFIIGLPFIGILTLQFRIFQIINKLNYFVFLSVVSIVLFSSLSTYFIQLHYGIEKLALAYSMSNMFIAVASYILLKYCMWKKNIINHN